MRYWDFCCIITCHFVFSAMYLLLLALATRFIRKVFHRGRNNWKTDEESEYPDDIISKIGTDTEENFRVFKRLATSWIPAKTTTINNNSTSKNMFGENFSAGRKRKHSSLCFSNAFNSFQLGHLFYFLFLSENEIKQNDLPKTSSTDQDVKCKR